MREVLKLSGVTVWLDLVEANTRVVLEIELADGLVIPLTLTRSETLAFSETLRDAVDRAYSTRTEVIS